MSSSEPTPGRPEPAPATPRPSSRRLVVAGLLELVVPGLGHLLVGRPRAALLFLAPVALLLAALLGLYASGGLTEIAAWVVTPGVLPLLIFINIALAIWRVAAVVDATRGTTRPRLALAVLAPAAFLLVLVPQTWLGSTMAGFSDWLDSSFAHGPEVTSPPDDTPPPGWTYAPDVEETPDPTQPLSSASLEPSVAATLGPSGTPRPRTSGTGNLPALNVTVPWTRPGAVPWGSDGRFDLLLLGSDAGRDRWSRRMDVMLLVEIDVATGKVAMIGIPRNLVNTPLPPGPARDAIACGCFRELLNGLYVEATIIHPERWPGSGAVAGIGAVRATVSELTKRPVDAVLVVDLWGMIKVVDAMGGIDINIPASVYDARYPDPIYGKIEMSLPKGQQHLDGREALFYARTRHQDSDYGRMARQQTLLLAVREQIGPKTILNAPDLFDAAKGFTWTDLPRDSLPNLVKLFGKAADASVKSLRIVPPTYPAWLTTAEITRIRTAIAKLLGVAVPATAAPTIGPTPPPPTTAPTTSATPSFSSAPSGSLAPGITSTPTGSPAPS